MRMGAIGWIGLFLVVSACGNGAPQGAGFTGIGTEPSPMTAPQSQLGSYVFRPTTQETVATRRTTDGQIVQSYSYASGGSSVPTGTALNGVPLSVMSSRSQQMPTQAAQVLVSGRSAASYASSRWGSKHTVPIEMGRSSARLKAVQKDGLTFGVVGKIRSPLLAGQGDVENLRNSAIAAVTERTGCGYGGNVVTQKDQYSVVHRFAVLLNC